MQAVRAAERPLIVAGGGIHHSEAEEALKALVDATGIPVASTQAGKGSLRYDHPADLGGIGHTGTAVSDDLARTADLIIGVGTRYTDFTTASNTLFQNPGVRFLNLNIAAFDAHKLAARTLVCDARAGLTALTDALAIPDTGSDGRTRPSTAAGQERWDAGRRGRLPAGDEHAVPTQTQVLGALDSVVGDDDVIINAAGSLPGDLHKLWRARSPRQYHLEYGYSCMGYEIPAGIGVQQAAPDTAVWSLVGDGTYLMMPTEIVTAVQEGLPVNLVLIQNHGYASIGGLSESVGGERFGTAYRYRAADGTFTGDPLPVDLAANAASLGMDVLRAKTVGELRTALATARASDRPTCVYVETDPTPTAPPAEAWWDVPVAETATRESAVQAREEYERQVTDRRRHL